MDNKQRSKLDSYNRVTDFNAKYAAILTPIPDYAAEQAKFDAKVKAIKTAAGVQEQPSATDFDTADTLKLAMARILIKFCTRAAAKARIIGNTALANLLDYAVSDIYRVPKTTSLQVAGNIRKTLNDNLTILTNVVAADIAEIDKAIAAYDKAKDAPTEAVQTKKASGTDALPNLFEGADKNLENMYALAVSYLTDTRPEVVDEFTLAKQLLSTGTRKTSITFAVQNKVDGAPVPNASVLDTDSGKTYTTNEHGIAKIDKHLAGHFHFSISAAGYTAFDLSADIKQGMANNFTIKL